ncbi:MAG: hypothetical protein JNL80_00770 [Phycisphaerae bacterium]|nr:hypothetical protein [Phycisphaerae bacterium]
MTLRSLVQLLLPFMVPAAARKRVMPPPDPSPPVAKASRRPTRVRSRKGGKTGERQTRYDTLVEEMKAAHGFRVRKWRRTMSGCAWELRFSDGRRQRMLESPYPKSPLSCSIFLHEVGHHAIGLGVVRPRCLEELRAWEWSLAAMEERGLEIDAKVRDRFRRSMEYAVAKAARRGIRELPIELLPFLPTARAAKR